MTESLLRRFITNWTLSQEAHGIPLGGRMLRRGDLAAVDLGRPAEIANVATLLEPLFSENAERVTDALDDFYGFSTGATLGTVHLFSAWPTPDLRPYGWEDAGTGPLMLRPVGGELPALPPGLRIEEVRDEASLLAFEETTIRGFPLTELEGQAPGAAFSPEILNDSRTHMWLGWEDDRPVAISATFIEAGINNVTLVATVPEARRRGYGAALTGRASLADPELPALLIATDEGVPVYERIGYMSLFDFTIWSRSRPGHSMP
ncbi:MAG: hypothetical protein ACJ789_07370 [Thermomicrobiales bacterium]